MKRTPYCEILQEYGGKFVDFAGFEMPVQFEGILHEHKAVRENVGLFDVSHMGEIMLRGKGALDTSNGFRQIFCPIPSPKTFRKTPRNLRFRGRTRLK